METEVEIRNVQGRDAQSCLEERARRLQKASRWAVRACAGLWGLAYDEARRLIERGQRFLDQAEARGERMEEQAGQEARKLRGRAREQIDQVAGKVRRQAGDTEEAAGSEIETVVAKALERLDIPSRDQIDRLSDQIEALSRKIDQQSQEDSPPPCL